MKIGRSATGSRLLASQRMAEWYDSPLGQRIGLPLRSVLTELSRDAFGYHALQLGQAASVLSLDDQLRIRHSIRAHTGHHAVDCRVEFDQLPFATESVDLVIAWHVLEDRPNPHELLREMDRVLRAEGRLLIVGINPTSLMHLSRYLPFVGRCFEPIHAGMHHAPWRVVDWLRVLGYEINVVERVGGLWPRCRCSTQNDGSQPRFDRKLNEVTWFLHGLYVISATRRVIKPVQPKPAFALKDWIGAAKPVGQRGVADPSGCTQHQRES